MFKSAELIYPIAFFQMFYNDKPVDWLLEHLIYTKVCNWEKDMVSVGARKRFLIILFILKLLPFFLIILESSTITIFIIK